MRVNEQEELECRSKGVMIDLSNPGMFDKAVATALALRYDLRPGWTYRGEYLRVPKHNTLKYERVPAGHIIIFDITTSTGEYLTHIEKTMEAQRLGLETVPLLWAGQALDVSAIRIRELFLNRTSCLGGVNIEGVVVKNYAMDNSMGDPVFMKVVSEEFKEAHGADWKIRNPQKKDVIQQIIDTYTIEARWRKAVQRLRDNGILKGEPADIGPLMREVPADLLTEREDEIKDALFTAFWKDIARGVTKGLPEWYKGQLEGGEVEA